MHARNMLLVTVRRGMEPSADAEDAYTTVRAAESELLTDFMVKLRDLAGGCCEECDAVLELADGLAATHG